MHVKFIAQTMPEYKGVDGKGQLLCLKSGDVCEVTDEIAKLLLQRYSRDFEVTIVERTEHAPKKDKQLKKTINFKSK